MPLNPYKGLQDEENNPLWFCLILIIKVVLDGFIVTGKGIIKVYPVVLLGELGCCQLLSIATFPTCTVIVCTNHQTSIELKQLVFAHVQQ